MNMNKIARHWLGHSVVWAMAAGLLTGCADEALGPDRELAYAPVASLGADNRAVDLGDCLHLQVPGGSKLSFRVYAQGVQIYSWTGTSWSFLGPSAVLSADAEGKSTVGTHYSGPTWESNSGGTLEGTVLQRCTPDADAIDWLLLGAVSDGPGIFQRVTFIQRVNTVGGKAPSDPGDFAGEEVSVPYTAVYLFYREQ
jgi:hypothetical protein